MDPLGGIVLNDGRGFASGGFVNIAPTYVTSGTYTFDAEKILQLAGSEIADQSVTPNLLAPATMTLIENVAKALSGAGGGSLQTVQAQFGAQTTTTSGSFVNTTTTAQITPHDASNKIKITVSGQMYIDTLSSTQEVYFTLSRNGTNIGDSSTGLMGFTPAGRYCPVEFTVVDSPSSTSAVTYTVQMNTDGGRTIIFPGNGGSKSSTIILEELTH